MTQADGPALRETARAKVNLCLHVTGRRADGMHLLDSLAVFPDLGDAVTAAPGAELSLRIVGPFAPGLSAGPDNLVLRAAAALRAELARSRGDLQARLDRLEAALNE